MALTWLLSCRSSSSYQAPDDPLFQSMPAAKTGISFRNTVESSKEFNVFRYRNFYNGGGVAIGDINNDGLSDIYLTANQSGNKLYLNKGGWKFDDITEKAGVAGTKTWSTGVAMADVNGDGWLDIYVCNSGDVEGGRRENELFINQQNGSFKEMAAEMGLADAGLTTHAAFFDYDGDGDLDCYILNNSYRPIESFGYNRNLRHIRDEKGGDKLYRNDNGRFTDVSGAAGIYGSEIGFGLGVTVGDLNGDNWMDIYVSNDFFERDYLYLNQRNGSFKEVLDTSMGHISLSSMGADMADINNDGLLDIFSTDMLPEGDYRLKTNTKFDDYDVFNAKLKNDFHHQFTRNMLQLNNGDGTFSEIGQLAGVHETDWSWGALIFDFQNDGWKDLLVCNGISKDLTDQDFIDYMANDANKNRVQQKGVFDFREFLDKMKATPIPNYAFVNNKDLRFTNRAWELGLGEPSFSNGAAYGDLDNDGDLDLVVNNENSPCGVFQNKSNEKEKNNYLRIQLKGAGMNTLGVGAKVLVQTDGNTQLQQQMPARGFESSVDPVMVFGLGKAAGANISVLWPDGRMQTLPNQAANTQITLVQDAAMEKFKFKDSLPAALYTDITGKISGDDLHKENVFVDFDRERLMPILVSLEGPKSAKGDLNGDGLEDIAVGGARGDEVKLLIQSASGFTVRTDPAIQQTKKFYEDVGIAVFDADGDKDNDIMIASGGNETEDPSINLFQTRLYLNDGKGNFSNGLAQMPAIQTNASCIRTGDADSDGDPDVFIGGRSVPGSYGDIPKSYLLLNDGKGRFSNATPPELERAGMVTDAQWTDLDNDQRPELALVGDWMPLTLFKWEGGQLKKWKTIAGSNGWWNAIQSADLDGDGDMDLVGGNLGLNSKFKADVRHPVKLYINDFDRNGQRESVMTLYKSDSMAYPLHLRGELVTQMPSLKKKFLYYKDYAAQPIEKVFTPEQLKGAAVREANYLQTCIFRNNGGGSFSMEALPLRAQFSPVMAILIEDLDGDGIKDIFLAGNFSGVKPETGRYDASYGTFLKGDGKNSYTYLTPAQSGMQLRGEARDLTTLLAADGALLVFAAMNNERPYLFKRKK